MLGYILLGGVIGYFLGRKDWKRIADEACETAGKAILLAEQYRAIVEEYENER